MGAGEVELTVEGSGTQRSKVRLRDDGVVLREAGPWSATVLALLRHFERVGFEGAPTVVGSGFADDGREMLSFVPGASPQPHAWSDEAVPDVGALLRDAHDASRSFEPPADAVWHPWFGRGLAGGAPVIGHCDTGPWNVIARDGRQVAIIDWELAGPVDATWDLARA